MTASSPSPVIIPVARPVIDIPQKTEPVAVPSPSTRRPVNDIEIPSAPSGTSFNPADSVLEGSSLPSSRGGSNTDGLGSVATESVAASSPLGRPTGSTVGGFSERLKQKTSDAVAASMKTDGGGGGNRPGKGQAAHLQGLAALSGSVSKSAALVADGAKPLKERTSKAERRAKQEAERAVKQATKEVEKMEVYEEEISSAEAYHSHDFQWESLRDEVEGLLERKAKPDETSAPTCKRPQKKDADCASSMIPWEAFYTRHSRNIFFKERRYLTKEFPELSRAFQTEENKPLRVLEIGCGTGSSVVPVLRANKEAVVYACDCSAAALQKAIKVVSTLNGSTFFPFMCDISLENLPSFLCRPPCDQPHSHVTKMFTELLTRGVKQMDVITLDDEEDGSDPDISTCIENPKQVQLGVLGGPALLPVCDGGLDIVTMIFTLSAIPVERMAHVLSECLVVLKPGGLLLFRDYGLYDMTMLRFAPWQRISDRLYQRQDGTLSYFFALEVVREIFTKVGFVEQELEYCCVQLMNRRKEVPMKRVWVHAKFRKPLT